MKKLSLLLPFMLLTACAASAPHEDIKRKVELVPVSELPRNAHLEQVRCPKARYPALEKREACKIDVRREVLANTLTKEGK